MGAAVQRDPSLRPASDDEDSRLLHMEVEGLLDKLGAGAVLNHLSENHAEHRLFAVSALGHQPSGEALMAQGVAPFRVLDPVKWFLSRGGVLPAVPRER